MVVFQGENPSALSGVTMIECMTLPFFHTVITFLIENSSRLHSGPSQIIAHLLPTCKGLVCTKTVERTFLNVC